MKFLCQRAAIWWNPATRKEEKVPLQQNAKKLKNENPELSDQGAGVQGCSKAVLAPALWHYQQFDCHQTSRWRCPPHPGLLNTNLLTKLQDKQSTWARLNKTMRRSHATIPGPGNGYRCDVKPTLDVRDNVNPSLDSGNVNTIPGTANGSSALNKFQKASNFNLSNYWWAQQFLKPSCPGHQRKLYHLTSWQVQIHPPY